jgi:outer membrane lipoprotein LolB
VTPDSRRRASLLLAAGLCAGLLACATPQPAQPPDGPAAVTGRLLIKVDASPGQPAQTLGASFELQGDERQGRLQLTSPLGTQLADARWSAQGVQLRTPQGEREFADLAALARDTLGEAVPLQALPYWLAGTPFPGAAHVAHGQGFAQGDWQVDLSRWPTDGQIEARRAQAPAVLLRARIDR